MNGIHDMGGMHGFGRVEVEPNEPVFHARWERRALGMVFQVVGAGWANIDAFRHAIERIEPAAYLRVGYYGRWLRALETLLVEAGVLGRGEVAARLNGVTSADSVVAGGAASAATTAPATPAPRPRSSSGPVGVVRTIPAVPRFAVGARVRARMIHPRGHTRLPGYVRGRQGVVHRVHPACVFPDTNAHDRGEKPQYVYNVRFAAREIWGSDAEPGAALHIDLFEDYLEVE